MENKIILQLIKNNLGELGMLVDSLQRAEKADPLLLEITIAKAKTFYQELMLLQPDNHALKNPTDEGASQMPSVEAIEFLSNPKIQTKQAEDKLPSNNAGEKEATEVPVSLFPDSEKRDEHSDADPPVETGVINVNTKEKIIEIEAPAKVDTPPQEARVLGEKFSKEPSLNERLAEITQRETRVKAKPVTSIKSAIGINDRFLFLRELFQNDSERFETIVGDLDRLTCFSDALEYLGQHVQWPKNETSLKFMELVKRRFDKLS
ncbi:MAG TPA: hypothetical protein PLK12_01595 [Prolixibacteraceae bacterium]|nr:hypothetical protein [Prolixibacteraceae bacterium]